MIKGQGDVLRSGDIYLVVVGDKGARRCGEVRLYLPGGGWWWRGEEMCSCQVTFTWWWLVIKVQGDVERSGDIYLVVGSGSGARRCVQVR